MKRASILVFCSLFVCLLASASVVQAGGFALYEWGNRSVAMATTGYAIRGDASIIATNPALMTQHEGGEVYAGITAISPRSDVVVNGATTKTKPKTFFVPHAYYTQQVEDNVWLGVGAFTRFGLGTHYPQGWAGAAELQYVNLDSVSLNPNIAFKFSDEFSLAIGVELLKGGIELERTAGGQQYHAETEGIGVGGNIAMHYQFDDEWSAGFLYRAPMKLASEGSSTWGAFGETSAGQQITAWLPSSYTLGVGYQPLEEWSIEFDTVFTRWELTDEMVYSGHLNSTDRLDYKNAWRFQLGTEYWTTDWLAVRFGYVYDITPTVSYEASYMLPANDRQLFSTGLGFKVNNLKIDWSFMYVMTKERTGLTIGGDSVEFKNGKTWITGASIGYEF